MNNLVSDSWGKTIGEDEPEPGMIPSVTQLLKAALFTIELGNGTRISGQAYIIEFNQEQVLGVGEPRRWSIELNGTEPLTIQEPGYTKGGVTAAESEPEPTESIDDTKSGHDTGNLDWVRKLKERAASQGV